MRSMIHLFSLLFCVLLVFASGCAENGQEEPATVSPEGTDVEEVTIEILEVPERVVAGDNFNIRWRVSGGSPGEISDTRILSGQIQEIADVNAYSARSLSQSGTSPQEFESTILATPGSNLYFRVYAVVDGNE